MKRTLAVVSLALAACATTDQPGSRGPRASDHLAAADQHDEVARQEVRYPDRRHDSIGSEPIAKGAWMRTWDSGVDHDRLAKIHRSAAAQVLAEYDEACGTRSPADVSVSPLQRYGIGGGRVDDGVVLYLSPRAGPPDQLLGDMRCHRAWMMLGRTDMAECPLDLAGLQVTARGDANEITVTLTVRDRSLVAELQRRASIELEMAARRNAVH